jgi:predicted nucleic acid-binding protein
VRLYLDTNILVYAMETDYDEGLRARRCLKQIDRREVEGVTSEITLAEALRGANASSRPELFQACCELIVAGGALQLVPVTRDILISAARLETERKIELPDGIHVATAVSTGCDAFLTEDKRLPTPPGLRKLSLVEWILDL